MKNQNHKHHITIHQRLEQLAHHRAVLTVVLSFMVLGYLKYETQFAHMLREAYVHGFSMVSAYTHHESPHHQEVTRMPVEYGSSIRATSTSGE